MKPHYRWTPEGPVFIGYRGMFFKSRIIEDGPELILWSELQDAESWVVGGLEYLGTSH